MNYPFGDKHPQIKVAQEGFALRLRRRQRTLHILALKDEVPKF